MPNLSRGLCVTEKAVLFKKSSVVLSEHLFCLFTIIIFSPVWHISTHIKAFFTSSLSMGMVKRSHF